MFNNSVFICMAHESNECEYLCILRAFVRAYLIDIRGFLCARVALWQMLSDVPQ